MKSTAEQIAYYSQRLRDHPEGWRVADWGSQSTQHIRFRILLEVVPKSIDTTISVLDVGCGTGEFSARPFWGLPENYTGWDIVPDFIAVARDRHKGWGRSFLVKDVLESTEVRAFDYVLASGLFTYGDERFFHQAVKRMWGLCRKAVAFNALSAWGSKPVGGEFQVDPAWALMYCEAFTKRLTLRHDYLDHDFTVYMYRYA